MKETRLLELSSLCGISSAEKAVCDFLIHELEKQNFSCNVDILGNLIAKRAGKGKRILIEAHMDQVGMMVSEITENGFVRFSPIGGFDLRVLPSQMVVIHGKREVRGIVCLHPDADNEELKTIELSRLSIDTGLGSEIEQFVSVGDLISFASDAFIQNGFCFGKALDNRACVEAVLSLIEEMGESTALTLLFAVQEEVGHLGATCADCYEDLDLAIVLDVTFGRTHDRSEGTFPCGNGPAIGVGPSVSYEETNCLLQIAKDSYLPHQVEVMGGSSGTDAWSIQLLEKGIPTVMLSIPIRYMHTPTEAVFLDDIRTSVELLSCYIKEVQKDD